MGCVSITIKHWTSGGSAIIGFYSSQVDGRYAEGSQAWGWGGYPRLTDKEYLEQVAIPRTLSYLGAIFQRVYGRPMTRNDICGQEDKTKSAAPKILLTPALTEIRAGVVRISWSQDIAGHIKITKNRVVINQGGFPAGYNYYDDLSAGTGTIEYCVEPG